MPHADFGEGVTAVVVAKDKALDEARSLAALDGRLAKFKLPKRVIFVDDLPRNAMGKVQKNVLRETYKGLYVYCQGGSERSVTQRRGAFPRLGVPARARPCRAWPG